MFPPAEVWSRTRELSTESADRPCKPRGISRVRTLYNWVCLGLRSRLLGYGLEGDSADFVVPAREPCMFDLGLQLHLRLLRRSPRMV